MLLSSQALVKSALARAGKATLTSLVISAACLRADCSVLTLIVSNLLRACCLFSHNCHNFHSFERLLAAYCASERPSRCWSIHLHQPCCWTVWKRRTSLLIYWNWVTITPVFVPAPAIFIVCIRASKASIGIDTAGAGCSSVPLAFSLNAWCWLGCLHQTLLCCHSTFRVRLLCCCLSQTLL